MYRATGDTDYLGDAESFYISYLYDEGDPGVRARSPVDPETVHTLFLESRNLPASMPLNKGDSTVQLAAN